MYARLRPTMTRTTRGRITSARFPSLVEEFCGFRYIARLNLVYYSVD
jgi:hypothetical protein